MLRKILFGISIALLSFIVWQVFLKPQDYLASFKINTSVGTVNQVIKSWHQSLENSKAIRDDNLNRFEHQITFNDSVFRYKWEIEKLNDSISKIYAHISDEKNGFKQRLLSPFFDTEFEKRSKKTVYDLYDRLSQHLEKFKVTYKGLDSIPETYCAYIPIKSTQSQKASRMMKYYPVLDNFALDKRIKSNGLPFIEVLDWNKKTDSITFNFCYPIKKIDSLPHHDLIKYKFRKATKALHATYNGNYITSDRAWYVLLEKANSQKISVRENPIEIFFTNPNMGGNELDWVAEIYIPIQ